MKFQLKALAAVALAAVSGLASAAIDLSSNTAGSVRPTSEMVLVAYDPLNNITYSRDLGTMISEFNFATNGTRVASVLAGWDTFVNTAGLVIENVRWGMFANDVFSPVATYFSTPNLAGTNPNQSRIGAINGAMTNLMNIHNAEGAHLTQEDGWAVLTSTQAGAQAGQMYATLTAQGQSAATGTLGQSLYFASFTSPTVASSTRTYFGNTLGAGSFSISNGNLMYATAPIPEPGTYALMLAGLLTLGAVARRRSSK